jgi:hypothetical protein
LSEGPSRASSFGFAPHRGFADTTPSASDLAYGDEGLIPADLRSIISQGDTTQVARLIVANPQLQVPVYTAIQRQHGYPAVQAVAQLASQARSPNAIRDESDLTHVKNGPLGPMAVVPDNYVGPQPPNAVRDSDYQRMIAIYQRIESGESSVHFASATSSRRMTALPPRFATLSQL